MHPPDFRRYAKNYTVMSPGLHRSSTHPEKVEEHLETPLDTVTPSESEDRTPHEDHEKQQPPPTNPMDDIPDGGYGWVVVFAVFLMNFALWGANAGFAIYFSYYLNDDIFPGGTKLDYSLVGGIAFGAGLLFTPLINLLSTKITTKGTLVVGNLCQFAGLMLASFSTKLWQLYLTQGIINSFGLAFISLPALTLLPQWFKKKRIFAGGLASAGSGIGGVVFNLGMQRVAQSKSVFWALRAQSIMCFGIICIATVLAKTRMNKKMTVAFYDIDCLKSAAFWLMVLFVITCMFGYVVVLYTMANFTTSLGYSAYQGSIAAAMILTGATIGRPIVGLLSDKIGPITMAATTYFLCTVFVLGMWVPARNFGTVIALSLILGTLLGTIFTSILGMTTQLFGLKRINVAFSMLWISLGVSGLVSPVIGISLKKGGSASAIQDPTQYVYCSVFSGISFFVCFLSLLCLRGYMITRNEMAGAKDIDLDYLHITVPFWGPVKNCLRPAWGV